MVFRQRQTATAVQGVGVVDQQFDRRTDGEIGADRRVDRDQCAARCLLERGVIADDPVEDGFAVFGFADLQEWMGFGFVDVVALRIDQVDFRRLSGDLTTKDETGFEICVGSVARGLTALQIRGHTAHIVDRLGHALHRRQTNLGTVAAVAAQLLDYTLGRGEVP